MVAMLGCGFGSSLPTETPTSVNRIQQTPTPQATLAPTRTPRPTPSGTQTPLARKVSVGNYQLYIECTGTGYPTVVMDAGLSASSRIWYLVAPKVASFTRVCIYDRANTGRSDRAPTPRTSQDLVNDLHALLANANVAPPYVMVGHSLGGMNVRLYASEYPTDVVGMVLVDSAHEDEWDRFRALLPPEYPGEPAPFKDYRKELTDPVKGSERIDLKQSGEQLQARRQSLGDKPLSVISHGKPVADVPAIVSPFVEKVWSDMQKDLLKWSTNGQQLIAEQSGHGIPTEQPQLVVDAIRQVVNATRRP